MDPDVRSDGKMVVHAPVSEAGDVPALFEAGAREFYAGVIDEGWSARSPGVFSPNRRDDAGSNLRSFRELGDAVGRAHDLGARFALAVNSFYPPERRSEVEAQVGEGAVRGVDAFVVADSWVATVVRRVAPGAAIHLSTVAAVMNSEAFRAHERFGFSRLVLPRHLTLGEIGAIGRALPGPVEIEAFVMNDGCPFEDGLCGFVHAHSVKSSPAHRIVARFGLAGPAKALAGFLPPRLLTRAAGAGASPVPCGFARDAIDVEAGASGVDARGFSGYLAGAFGLERLRFRCGLCAIPSLASAGVRVLKIAGRRYPLRHRVMEVDAVKRAIDAAAGTPRERFVAVCRSLFREARGFPCEGRFCYWV